MSHKRSHSNTISTRILVILVKSKSTHGMVRSVVVDRQFTSGARLFQGTQTRFNVLFFIVTLYVHLQYYLVQLLMSLVILLLLGKSYTLTDLRASAFTTRRILNFILQFGERNRYGFHRDYGRISSNLNLHVYKIVYYILLKKKFDRI